MDIKVSCSEQKKEKTTQSIGAEQQVKNTRANKAIEGLSLDDDVGGDIYIFGMDQFDKLVFLLDKMNK